MGYLNLFFLEDSGYESHGSPPKRLPHRCAGIGLAPGVRAGRRPSGGSMMSDDRHEVVLYSRQCGIGAFGPVTLPDVDPRQILLVADPHPGRR